MSEQYNDLLQVARSAANFAGDLIKGYSAKVDSIKVEQKSLNDFVSVVDREAEQLAKQTILAAFPNHRIIGEEYGEQLSSSDVTWYIDPLDGTTNFLRSIPHYAVSIGVCIGNEPIVGVIYDPAKNELYSATHQGGSYMNDRPISVSESAGMSGALVATGVPYSGTYLERLDSFVGTMQTTLGRETSGIRRLGAASLDLAYVAAGRYEVYWEAGLKPWDICAGVVLVRESGGVVTDLTGGNAFLSSGDILAGTGSAHSEMLAITSHHYS
ncbi:MAG: inositol monophosphatase family protein [Pseudomonadota bacterium]